MDAVKTYGAVQGMADETHTQKAGGLVLTALSPTDEIYLVLISHAPPYPQSSQHGQDFLWPSLFPGEVVKCKEGHPLF